MPRWRDSNHTARNFSRDASRKRRSRNALVRDVQPVIIPLGIPSEVTVTGENITIVPVAMVCNVVNATSGETHVVHVPINPP